MTAARIYTSASIVILLAGTALAEDNAIEAYYDFGRKGATALVEEEDLSDEFYYQKYNVKYSHKYSSSSSVGLRYQYYRKDYDSLRDRDNIFNAGAVSLDTMLYSREKFSAKFGPDIEVKEKIYRNSGASNYDQIRCEAPLTFKKEDDWTIRMRSGINSYHYPDAPKDQLKLNAKLEASKKLFDDRLEVSAFYRYQYVYRQKIADRHEKTYGASAEAKVELGAIREVGAGLEQGMDNTIIYEEREDSFDYKFLSWFLKANFALLEKIKGGLKYTSMTREYADYNHNNNGFMAENSWRINIFETKDASLDSRLSYMHKQFRYPYVATPFSFHNDNVFCEAEFEKKLDWKVVLGSDVRFYNYPANRTNDKIYYIEKVGIEKYFFKKDLALGFDYRYTFKNFLHKLDVIEDVFRLHTSLKF